MSAEQLRGQPTYARSDIWALGGVLYEMAAKPGILAIKTGQRPRFKVIGIQTRGKWNKIRC
jgi:serine/threonine protein kinase